MTVLYGRVIEKRDISKVQKLEKLTDPFTFWDEVRRLCRNVKSDHAIHRWQCLAELRYKEILAEERFKK